MPKISVVVPVYNVEEYLNECIKSILNQTFIDFELILVDDGSVDKSGQICDEYAVQDNRVKVIHQANKGVSIARNNAIAIAKSEYICFIDSDDYIDRTMFKKLYDVITRNDCDLVKCGYSSFRDGIVVDTKVFKESKIFIDDTLVRLAMDGVLFTIPCNGIYKRKIVEKVKFPENLVEEDVYFSGMYLFLSRKIGFVNEALYFYRQNSNSIMNQTVLNNKPLDGIVTLSLLHEELKLKGLSDCYVFAKLRKRMAGRLYGVLKKTSFRISMNLEFYDLICENLSMIRRLKMMVFRLFGRIILKG